MMINANMNLGRFTCIVGIALASAATSAGAADSDGGRERFLSIYQELVETDTTLSQGSCTIAAQRMQRRLLRAGYSVEEARVVVAEGFPTQGNLLARLSGSNAEAPALLLLAHIDVVEADPADWKRNPFRLIEEDGYFYARGAVDDKAMAAVFVDILVRFREEGFTPQQTIKLALTCGEETDAHFNGVQYLLAHDRDALEAGFALNEGGKGFLDEQGIPRTFEIQAGEKIYQDYVLTATSPGGHSARPGADNAIVRLAQALEKIGDHVFPAKPNEVTRQFFAKSAPSYSGQTAIDMEEIAKDDPDAAALERIARADPVWNALLRTTCEPTLVEAGHAVNAMPQHAEANVNCRILPGTSTAEVKSVLIRQIADPSISVELREAPGPVSPAPPLTADVIEPIVRIAGEMWPGVPVIPSMSTGATDGRFLLAAGIPTYGVSGIFRDPDGNGVHGLNERIRVKSLYDAREFLYRLVKAYSGPARP